MAAVYSQLSHHITKKFLSFYFSQRQQKTLQSKETASRQKRAEMIIAEAPKNFYTNLNILVMQVFLLLWLGSLFATLGGLTKLDLPDALKAYLIFAVLFGSVGPSMLLSQNLLILGYKIFGKHVDKDALLLSYGHVNQAYYAPKIKAKKRIIFDDNYERNHRIAQIASGMILLSAFIPAMYFAVFK